MARDRNQKGRVVEAGKKTKVWRGHFYVYSRTPDGDEIRKHRNVTLGPKSRLKKWEAEKKLKEIIDREINEGQAVADPTTTLRQFWEERFLPLQVRWRESTREVIKIVFTKHVLERFGAKPLSEVKRFDLQTHLNSLALVYSKSLVKKVRTWTKAVLDEAVEQEFIAKNPARKLSLPPTRGTCKRFLTLGEYHKMLSVLQGRDHLIFRLFVLCAFRPGELFALRWKSLEGATLKVDASVFRGQLGSPKTKSSEAAVAVPDSLLADLMDWYEASGRPNREALIFPSRVNKPINSQNYLKRDVLRPAAEQVGIEGLTFQCLRRTFATHFHGVGTVKDQQSQMRHSTAQMSIDVYTQNVSESLKFAVEAFDRKLRDSGGLDPTDPGGIERSLEPGILNLNQLESLSKAERVLNPSEPKSLEGENGSD